ncbi:histidine kinase dimerization/phosphoacceptor domain -containing protein [Methylobacterium sp. Leaf85]|uniref:histidine kinase dimerization/phosphoacceptor domain -containing protein n=1 Tax=Methylobacterium sp. Leaf85 TaxID=1736241 RepID=UPI0006F70975|nr:histidine kinase dimerization/phosphoacceptor domain -containing protein [Methylobacterium sp. Leaf85]KQO54715.1 histidine kinase [Methylobacterium sp. Leaf85]
MMEADDAWHLTDRLGAEHGRGDPFAAAIRATRMAMLITDPRQADNPIVFVNDAFLRMTGYSRAEVMGRNCRLLQGEETSADAVRQIRDAIAAKRDVAVDILNYRKDGSQFWNALYVSPVSSDEGETVYFFASQLDVTDRIDALMQTRNEKIHFEREVEKRTRELTEALAAKTMLVHEVDHRVKNNLQMIASLLTLQTRTITDPDAKASLKSMLARIEALGTVHKRLYQSNDVQRFDVAAFAQELAVDLVRGSGRQEIELDVDLVSVEVAVEQAPPVALVMNELLTNALKHAFPRDAGGRLLVSVKPEGEEIRITIADDGIGMPVDVGGGRTFGKRLIESLVRQLNADIAWHPANPGTRIEIRLPRGGTGHRESM